MAPFKEERGESPKVTRRTLYSMSQWVGDGWLNATVVAEFTHVPSEGGVEVQTVVGGNAPRGNRWKPRIQGTLFPEGNEPTRDGQSPNPPSAPTTAQEAQGNSWLEGLGDPQSYGSRSVTSTASSSPDRLSPVQIMRDSKSDSSCQAEGPKGQSPGPSSKTNRKTSRQPTPHSQISKALRTGSDASSVKSSSNPRKSHPASSRKTKVPRG